MSEKFFNLLVISMISTVPVIYPAFKGDIIATQWYALILFVVFPLVGVLCIFANPKWKGKTFTWKLRFFFEPLVAFCAPWAITLTVITLIQNL